MSDQFAEAGLIDAARQAKLVEIIGEIEAIRSEGAGPNGIAADGWHRNPDLFHLQRRIVKLVGDSPALLAPSLARQVPLWRHVLGAGEVLHLLPDREGADDNAALVDALADADRVVFIRSDNVEALDLVVHRLSVGEPLPDADPGPTGGSGDAAIQQLADAAPDERRQLAIAWREERREANERARRAELAVAVLPPVPPVSPDPSFDARVIAATLQDASTTTGPRVSVVVPNRDADEDLASLVQALELTHYRPLELVLVDNGSSDGSLAVAEAADLDVVIDASPHNRSFSESVNAGVAAATGELILLCNNDVLPIGRDWLGRLVATMHHTGAAAVGARLVYTPVAGGSDRARRSRSLQHAGIGFVTMRGIPRPRNVGTGDDPLGVGFGSTSAVVGATAALLLLDAAALDRAGGLHEEYVYGSEDVDLMLSLREDGELVVVDGSVFAWHREFGTQDRQQAAARQERWEHNHRVLMQRWGPALAREVLQDKVRGHGLFAIEPLRVAVDAGVDNGQLVSDLEASGVTVVALDGDPDALVSTRPVDVADRAPIHVAWATTNDPWEDTEFDLFDLVLTDDIGKAAGALARYGRAATIIDPRQPAASLLSALEEWVATPRAALLTSSTDWSWAPRWGDTHVAFAVARALEQAGVPTRVHVFSELDEPHVLRSDIAIQLQGLRWWPPARGRLDVLWTISHPDLMPEELDGFALVAVASSPAARRLSDATSKQVIALHQATDPDRFRPRPGGRPHQLLMVGNSRGVRRRIVDDLLAIGARPALYGHGWEDPDTAELVVADHLPNDRLAAHYAAADIVLNDHWDDMRRDGFLSNRLYDALAAGGFVLSDRVDGIEEEFAGAVITYKGREELADLLEVWLEDPTGRRRRSTIGRHHVLAHHTWQHRVDQLLNELHARDLFASRRLARRLAAHAPDAPGRLRVTAIAGMHRSGTSLVAAIAGLLGLDLGAEGRLMPATADNPLGYWENQALTTFADQLLRWQLGGSWHEAPDLGDEWEQSTELDSWRARAIRVLRAELGGRPGSVGWKDPRTSLLLPFWRTVAEVHRVVHVVRSPDAVIGSVAARDGLDAEHIAAAWLDHVSALLRAAPDALLIQQEDVHRDPGEVAVRLAQHLDLPTPTGSALAQVNELVQPSLRRADDHRAPDGPNVTAARELHRLLREDELAAVIASEDRHRTRTWAVFSEVPPGPPVDPTPDDALEPDLDQA
ncbi:MAG: glycosyltransferase [Nitriliruptorales bacterium]|nr:glycosyltransferase [Nitriliruptorales bacterium]